MLQKVDFSPSRDHLYVLGDLVNRGPDSLGVLQRLRELGSSATCLLGNHDLHLLAVAHGVHAPRRGDTFDALLSAPDRNDWVNWLAQQRMADWAHGWLMVHAGVVPQWDAAQTISLAGEVEAVLRSPDRGEFFQQLFGNEPKRWHDGLEGMDRLRCVVNSLTRLRFCSADGTMEFNGKSGIDKAPEGFMPWFEVPGRRTADTPVAFGHWSTLGLVSTDKLLSLDTGCVWGGQLTAARIDGATREVIQIDCPQAQKPGKG